LISKKEPIKYEYTPQRGGIVKLTFKIKDKEGLVHRSQMHLHIVGSSQQQMAKTQKVTQDTLTLIPSKKEYNPSEDKEGEVFIQSPFAPCEGILCSFNSISIDILLCEYHLWKNRNWFSFSL
jgi:hypothetical protein